MQSHWINAKNLFGAKALGRRVGSAAARRKTTATARRKNQLGTEWEDGGETRKVKHAGAIGIRAPFAVDEKRS